MISTKYSVREQNEALVLKTIIAQKEISRAELAHQTALNKASVSDITKTLLEKNFIFETRVGDASTAGGRKPILLTFNPNAGLVITIDLGAKYIEAALSTLAGALLTVIRRKPLEITKKNAEKEILTIVQELQETAPTTTHGIVGMTIAIHGIVYHQQILFTPAYDLDGFHLQERLSIHFNFPVYLENEANLAALGEYTFNSPYENLIALSIHSGIGAGIVQKGKLHTGQHGIAGEIGHMTIHLNGQSCRCGNCGCLELYASNDALYEQAATLLGVEKNSDALYSAWKSQQEKLMPLFQHHSQLIAAGIHNLIVAHDPEVIIINNSVISKIPDLLTMIQDQVSSRFSKNIPIQISPLKGDAILYGGVANTAQNFLNIQGLKLDQ